MRIAYHPNSGTLSDYTLGVWLAATVAAWPTVGAGTLINVRDPKHPFRIERETSTVDKETIGGEPFSKINYTRYEASLEFPPIKEDEAAIWRAFCNATIDFRKPFILEHPLTLEKIIMTGKQPFPFTRTGYNSYTGGSVKWSERI